MTRLQNTLCATLEALLAGKKIRMPDAGGEILETFLHLSRARTCRDHGPNPITWEALAAYAQIMRKSIPPHHAAIIMALDDVWMKNAGRRINPSAEGKPVMAPMVSSTPLSAGLFDAIMGG